MESHRYELDLRDIAREVAPAVAAFLLLVLIFRLLFVAHLTPHPHLAFDMDSTVIGHQAAAAKAGEKQDILLVGDSSCLMGAQADVVEKLSGFKVLSLATLSFLDLPSQGRLVKAFCAASSSQGKELKGVVLLMHPEGLRRAGVSERHAEFLAAGLEDRPAKIDNALESLCGFPIIRDCFLGPGMPRILPGEYGIEFGFSKDLSRYMTRHNGSARDPGRFAHDETAVKPEYRLAASVREKSGQFRQAVPSEVRLYVGVTPVPQSLAGDHYEAKALERLGLWGGWLKADGILRDLPLVLPDEAFASASHLRPGPAGDYSRRLAEIVAAALSNR